ncbi:hypothetical protein D3C71_1749260 [compost metagenome]
MPAILGVEFEEAHVGGNFFGGVVLPLASVDGVRHERTNHGAGFEDQLARIDAEFHAVFPQAQAAAPGVDARVDVQ